jgi:hypothetical protein
MHSEPNLLLPGQRDRLLYSAITIASRWYSRTRAPSRFIGGVWLTGFGIASRLPREHQPPVPLEVIGGTLAHMAPEQTGRMNRSVDVRSDLYALGVTFYEMLTGTLPFTATDPMEWVHCRPDRLNRHGTIGDWDR